MLTCAYVRLIYLLILIFLTRLNVVSVFCTLSFVIPSFIRLLWVWSRVVFTAPLQQYLFFFFEVMHCYLCICGSLVEPPHFINHLKVPPVKSATRVQDRNSLNVFKCPLSLLGYYQAHVEFADFYYWFCGGTNTWTFTFKHG